MKKKIDIKILGILFLFVFILEFWISINSYTHDLYNRIDSAIFFMCGKAWVNGMIPYVDYADAKGPLLWLIFGAGYLLSNYNYLGIFWIECIFYTIAFFYCYKIGYLFLRDKKTALLCSLLMSFSFFCWAYHYETRAEDFCQPFITASLYYTLRAIYGFKRDRDVTLASFITGISFAAALLMKFTIGAMIVILFIALFWYLIKRRKDLIWKSLLFAISGISIVLLPFILYFLYTGHFHDFIHEYFIATSQTIVKTPTLGSMIKDYLLDGWGSIFHIHIVKSIIICFLLANIIAGCIYFYKKLPVFKWIPAIIAFWFVSISMYHALGYYYHSFAVFAIFPVIMYLAFFKWSIRKKLHLTIIACAIIVVVIAGNMPFLRSNFFLSKTKERADFYYVNRILSQAPNPKIMFSFYDTGYGTPVNALPGCKYWTGQMGATDEMVSEREFAVTQRLPDFVFIMMYTNYDYFLIDLLQQSGYVKYYTWITQEGTGRFETHLYGRPCLSLPSNDLHISPMDILLKKQIIPVKSKFLK